MATGLKEKKFLGIILDEYLTWKKHIQLVENKVSKKVDVLYKTIKLINSKCLESIYLSFIHSYFNYANISLASTNKTKPKNLLGKQKQTACIIFNRDPLRL